MLGVLLVAACHNPPERTNPVGRMFLDFVDPARPNWTGTGPRPLATTVWYPAAETSAEEPWSLGIFKFGTVAPGATILPSAEKFPLIIVSHGTGGAAAQLSWLAEQLATAGYMVTAVNHHGNTAAEDEYLAQGFMLWWERAADISRVIDNLLADPTFGPRIDTSKIGAAGFSLGGYSVLSVAGAITDRDRWKAFCADHADDPGCNLPPESPFSMEDLEALILDDSVVGESVARSAISHQDDRIRAVFAIAPVLGSSFTLESLGDIDIPVRVVVGDQDDQALPDVTAVPVATAITRASLELLPGVGHYTFLAECTFKGRLFVKQLCTDPEGTDRRQIHNEVASDVLRFFDFNFGK